MKESGLPITINQDTQNALVDLHGKEGDYRLVLSARPSLSEPRSLHIQSVLTKPELSKLLSHPTLLEWMNAKNADIVFGRYYYIDNDRMLIFELALPVIEEKCDWATFDEFLRMAIYSTEDALAQLKAVAEAQESP